MPQKIATSGIGSVKLQDELQISLKATEPQAIGIASAFVSVSGVEKSEYILNDLGCHHRRLIAGVDHCVTHPEALYLARESGWEVRIGQSHQGIFHPKIFVAGKKFSQSGQILDPCFVYIGSANLTSGGLNSNVECGLIAENNECPPDASHAFAELWNNAQIADDNVLKNYGALFAEKNRRRSPAELEALEIGDIKLPSAITCGQLLKQKSPKRGAFKVQFSKAAWAGLQSFTGEHRFQVEFPRAAGEVISQLIGPKISPKNDVDVYCAEDEKTRKMKYRFYKDNGMFRLNIPNDVPGVQWVRKHEDGIALISRGLPGGAPIQLSIFLPGQEEYDAISRSLLLGTWAHTPTRLYGWF